MDIGCVKTFDMDGGLTVLNKNTHTHIYIDIFVEHYIQTIPQAKKIDQVG